MQTRTLRSGSMPVAMTTCELPEIEVELSEREFWRLQETEDSVRGYEFEDGRLIPMPPMTAPQSTAWGKIFARLDAYLEEHNPGYAWQDLYVRLIPSGRRRYFPDIVYLANEDLHRFDGMRVNGAPTMVCEIASQGTRRRDKGPKMRAYHAAGVRWYWLLDLVNSRMEEYRWAEAGYERVSSTPVGEVFRPALFPGLEIPLRWRTPPVPGTAGK